MSQFVTIGTQICKDIEISNNGPNNATNVKVDFTIPVGTKYKAAFPTVGTYDETLNRWNIPILKYKETVKIRLCLEVTLDCVSSPTVTYVITSDQCAVADENACGSTVYETLDCCNILGCINTDDTITGDGTAENPFSAVVPPGSNTYITALSFNPATGDLTATRNDTVTIIANLDGRYTDTFNVTDEDARTILIGDGDTITLDKALHIGTSGHIPNGELGISAQASDSGDLSGINVAHGNVVQGSTGATLTGATNSGIYQATNTTFAVGDSSIVSGSGNAYSNIYYTFAIGDSNTVDDTDSSVIAGTAVTGNSVYRSYVGGLRYTGTNVESSLILHNNQDIVNSVFTDVVASIIAGQTANASTHSNITGSILMGEVPDLPDVEGSIVINSTRPFGAQPATPVGTFTGASIDSSFVSVRGNSLGGNIGASFLGGTGHSLYSGGTTEKIFSSVIVGDDHTAAATAGSNDILRSFVGGTDHTINGTVDNSLVVGDSLDFNDTVTNSIITSGPIPALGGASINPTVTNGVVHNCIIGGNAHKIDSDIYGCVVNGVAVEFLDTTANDIRNSIFNNGDFRQNVFQVIDTTRINCSVFSTGDMVIDNASIVESSMVCGSATTLDTGSVVSSVVLGTSTVGTTISGFVNSSIINAGDSSIGGTVLFTGSIGRSIISANNLTTEDGSSLTTSIITGENHIIDGDLENSIIGGDGFDTVAGNIISGILNVGTNNTLDSTNGFIGRMGIFGPNVTINGPAEELLVVNGGATTISGGGGFTTQNGIIFNSGSGTITEVTGFLAGGGTVTINGDLATGGSANNVFVFGANVEANDDDQVIIGGAGAKTGGVGHAGAWVIGGTLGTLTSASANRFHSKFTEGYVLYTDSGGTTGATMYANQGSWSSLSSEQYKENFEDVDYREMLHRFDKVDIKKWSYKDKTERNIGITAEDFYNIAGYDIADAPDRISTTDTGGTVMGIMKGMYEEIKELREEIKQLKA